MQFTFSSFVFYLLALSATITTAAPVLEKRDVFVPPILTPGKNAIWRRGTTQTVKWDVSKPPAQITNPKGRIVLRDVEAGILLLDRKPLAEGFDILDGQRQITVPNDLPTGKYQCVLFGNSGNWSPIFNIVGTDYRAISEAHTAWSSPRPSTND